MKLRALGGYNCVVEGEAYMVYESWPGNFLIKCQVGDHLLDGHMDQEGYLVGFEMPLDRYEASGQIGEIKFALWWEGLDGPGIDAQQVLDKCRDAVQTLCKLGFIPLTGDPKVSLEAVNRLVREGKL